VKQAGDSVSRQPRLKGELERSGGFYQMMRCRALQSAKANVRQMGPSLSCRFDRRPATRSVKPDASFGIQSDVVENARRARDNSVVLLAL
jgi:hypothetical protein